MKSLRFLPVICLVATWSCAPLPPSQEEDPDTSVEDRATIQAMTEPYAAAYNAGDIDAMLEFYDEQVVLMFPDQGTSTGHASVRNFMEQLLEQGTPEISILPAELIVSGDIAFERGTYTEVLTPESGNPSETNNKYLVVWRKLADGSWKVARLMTNSNGAPAG